MRILRFFFPIAFGMSKNRGLLTAGIIIHSAICLLYPVLSAVAFLLSWMLVALAAVTLILMPLVPVLAILSIVFLFIMLAIGIAVPFYCAGGILLGILNYKKELSVLEYRSETVTDSVPLP